MISDGSRSHPRERVGLEHNKGVSVWGSELGPVMVGSVVRVCCSSLLSLQLSCCTCLLPQESSSR